MLRIHRWKSGTAAIMATAITTSVVAPLFTFAPANAQYNNRIGQQYNRNITIPSGVAFPVTYEKEKVVVSPGESADLTLRIANDIIDRNRNVLIPAGTQVVGRLESVNLDRDYSRDRDYPTDRDYSTDRDSNTRKGVRFVARELVFSSNRRQQINASSRTYTRTERISKGADTGNILTDAAIGAGAATVISLITGNRKIELLEPLGGAAAGALASVLLRKKEADVFVIRPEQDLRLTLDSDLTLYSYRY
ncbi:MAG: conjugal transfer protein TrbI [Desmonostoc vinosum HA7617-LM4]|jgi:hypothetical protein|nr:conjugal transfer protein TrbI [Desmonostoc vinosum HA7617-LM4]